MKRIVLKKGKEINIARRHPWIFSGAIKHKPSDIINGEHVEVYDYKDHYLATGYYHNSSIAVRVLSFEQVTIDETFWIKRISAACTYRKSIDLVENVTTNAYRLINGEGDNVPGLIIDIYNTCAVIQCHTYGCYKDRMHIAKAVDTVYKGSLDTIYFKTKEMPSDIIVKEEEFFKGDTHKTMVLENGIQFSVDWVKGQKTGFFLDQRINRALVGKYATNKTVLNCFCYTGGFSMYALEHNALQVTSIDISKTATDLVEENHTINGYDNDKHAIRTENVMHALQNETLPLFDIVIVDPPAFAKSQKKRHNAVQAYKRLNAMALEKVKTGGYLFTFSCSQVVNTELFNNTIMSAAIEVGRSIRIVERLNQGPDHPVNIYHPEGTYLKGLLLYVEK